MIDHERARELALMPVTDLDPADRNWLAAHLEWCEACSAVVTAAPPVEAALIDDVPAVPSEEPAPAAPAARRRLVERLTTEPLRRRAMTLTVGMVAVAILAGGLAWNTAPRTDQTVANASQSPGTASPAASEGRDPWASVSPSSSFEPLSDESPTPTAALTARGAQGVVVPLDASFRLASLNATPASRLAARLTVEPAFVFSVKADAADRAAIITPASRLVAGTVYRFALSGASGELLDTWAFQARQPLRVVGTLPGHQTTDVPINTGIEVTFDQDGVADAGSHFTIKPATAGRFEQHGRTLAFIPNRPLSPATIYSVTVTRGVTNAGTSEATIVDTRFQFETAAITEPTVSMNFTFQDALVESSTADRPAIGLWGYVEEGKSPKTTPIQVYRFANLDAAITAFRALRARADWSRWSTDDLVDTTRLTRVTASDVRLNRHEDSFWIQLPNRLRAGRYLVQMTAGQRPIQIVLQVTDVAGYLAVSETRTLVWANDLKSGRPIAGAAASSDGTAIGRTDGRGLAIGKTPKGLLPQPADACARPCDPVVTVRMADGRSIFLPARAQYDKLEGYGDSYYWYAADPGYWSLLHTDRFRYRQTDKVNVWGVIRDRDTGKVPAAVTVRLTLQSNGDGPAITTLALRPGSSGAFSGSIQLTALPEGYYTVAVLVGKTVVRSTDIVVGPIAKPAYRLDVTTGRWVYIAGDRIRITVNASFFEGTPVQGVGLRIDGFVEQKVTTNASGNAIYATTAKAEPGQEGPFNTTVQASPATAEEGEIGAASREFVVFPSSRTIDASPTISGGRVRVSGSVHLVDVDRLESEIATGQSIWELDPRGAPVGGTMVTARFVELVPHRRQVGTQYDFIQKKVVPTYEESLVEHDAGTVRVRTAADGTFKASVPATTADHDYHVVITAGDHDGHVAKVTSYANRHPWQAYEDEYASLRASGSNPNVVPTYGIDDRVDVTMHDPITKQATGDGTRYLFFEAARGLHSATVQSSPRYATTFGRTAAPNMTISAIRFTGHGYVGPVQFGAQFRTADRRIQVDLSLGAARYAPGDTATVNVRTRTASGAPVATTVILRAVDEKLFSIGAAQDDDPLNELYASVGSGMVGSYVSHRTPRISSGEGGDTTGGGGDEREDFRDSVLFQTITTGSDGRGSVSFKVADDLTSWRVIAAAITSRLEAGSGSVLVPVGLPFFVDATIAPDYLVADRPTIVVRTFGTDLKAGDAVTVAVTSTSLGFASGPISTTAFAAVDVPLPQLHKGIETLTITATTGAGASARTDRLTRSFSVVDTRLMRTRTNYVELPSSGAFSGGDGLTTLVVSDASAGRLMPLLTSLASDDGARVDQGIAASAARALLVSRYGSAAGSFDPLTFEASRYQAPDGGLALLPYASSDLELSSTVAIVAPDEVNRG
jgi:alpha-2-macroglobulin